MAKHSHHSHSIPENSTTRRLWITMALNLLITVAEIIGGVLAHSLALISDALHNFSDGIAVLLTFIALNLKKYDFSDRHTFGLKRAEIFAAVINSSFLLGISIYLFYESARRLTHPSPVGGRMMVIIAAIGLTANLAGTLLLKKISSENLNIRSAYFHLFSDALSSFAVVLGGLAIINWKIYWIDPVLTILISIYILRKSFQILSEAVHILMEGAPPDISRKDIQQLVETLAEVEDIHHIHLWMVGDGDVHLEAHVNVRDMSISESDLLRKRIERMLVKKFGINHITLQFECKQCLEEQISGKRC